MEHLPLFPLPLSKTMRRYCHTVMNLSQTISWGFDQPWWGELQDAGKGVQTPSSIVNSHFNKEDPSS